MIQDCESEPCNYSWTLPNNHTQTTYHTTSGHTPHHTPHQSTHPFLHKPHHITPHHITSKYPHKHHTQRHTEVYDFFLNIHLSCVLLQVFESVRTDETYQVRRSTLMDLYVPMKGATSSTGSGGTPSTND